MIDTKFRYIYVCEECREIVSRELTLEQIEGLHIGFESVGSVQCSCNKLGCNFAELSERLQFTGLKDKAGKDIYEGDIILCQNKPYSVHWFNDEGRWIFKRLWRYALTAE